MKRAVAFCQVIERQQGAKVHKVSSKLIAEMFQAVVEAHEESEPEPDQPPEDGKERARLQCEAEHVDGTMNASEKEAKIALLKAAAPDGVSRILSNVRCLSEGVDVPALDAVLFLTPRNSQIDVVQSVGRVMRNPPGKRRGYIVLPVVIPAKMEPHEALRDNQVYKVVWQVLQALRSHDDRFDAMINKLDLTGKDTSKMEVIAITDKLSKRVPRQESSGKSAAKKKAQGMAQGGSALGTLGTGAPAKEQKHTALAFDIGEIERAAFARLAHELCDDINDSISDEEIIEMLAQHLVTKPVFDALFAGHDFASQNSMSKAMQDVLDALQEHHLDKESDTLQAFYDSVKLRAEGIDSAEGKQKIIVELYDKFFRNALPRMSERLGIVYTPVEIVDLEPALRRDPFVRSPASRRHHRRRSGALPERLPAGAPLQGGRLLLRLRHPPLAGLPRALRRQPGQGAAAHSPREDRRGLLGRVARGLREGRGVRGRHRQRAQEADLGPQSTLPRREDAVWPRQGSRGEGQDGHPI